VFCGDFQVATLVFPYILTLHHHIHYLTSLTFSENGCVLSKFLELVQIFHCCDSDLEIWRTCSSCKNPTWLLWKVLKANYFWIYKECVKVLHPKISNFIDFWLIWITISHKKIINSIYTLGFISEKTPCIYVKKWVRVHEKKLGFRNILKSRIGCIRFQVYISVKYVFIGNSIDYMDWLRPRWHEVSLNERWIFLPRQILWGRLGMFIMPLSIGGARESQLRLSRGTGEIVNEGVAIEWVDRLCANLGEGYDFPYI